MQVEPQDVPSGPDRPGRSRWVVAVATIAGWYVVVAAVCAIAISQLSNVHDPVCGNDWRCFTPRENAISVAIFWGIPIGAIAILGGGLWLRT